MATFIFSCIVKVYFKKSQHFRNAKILLAYFKQDYGEREEWENDRLYQKHISGCHFVDSDDGLTTYTRLSAANNLVVSFPFS